jgi:arabinofuranosyltransferase
MADESTSSIAPDKVEAPTVKDVVGISGVDRPSPEIHPPVYAFLAVALALAAYVLMVWNLNLVMDDLFITLRYAKNLADGHGLVFNIGERVEGYTCFLWVVILAGLARLGVDIESASRALSAAAGALILPLAYASARRLKVSPWIALTAPAMLAAMPAYACWASSGMEALPVACLLAVALWLYVGDHSSLIVPAVLALAIMTRPDAAVIAAVIGAERFFYWRGRAEFWRWTGVFLMVFGPYYVWRCSYYGYPLPNTFYAKVGTTCDQLERGFAYLRDFSKEGGAPVVGSALIGAVLARTRTVVTLLIAGALFCAYVVAVGGDAFGLARFFAPVLPLFAVLAAVGFERLLGGSRWSRVAGAVVAATALIAFACDAWRDLPAAHARGAEYTALVNYQKMVAGWLRNNLRPGEAVATCGIEVVGYYGNVRVIDMLGLVDAHIAHREVAGFGSGLPGHEKYDSDYVLDQRPAYILIPSPSTPLRLSLNAVTDMWKNPRFQNEYVPTRFGFRRRQDLR